MFQRQSKAVFVLVALMATPLLAESGAALFGAAALSGAAMPAIQGAESAAADVYTNQMQAQTSMYATGRAADVSEYEAALQSNTALQMGGLQEWLNAYNQQQTTLRLGMQLGALNNANQMNYALNMQNLYTKYGLMNYGLGLQQQIANANFLGAALQTGALPYFQNYNSAYFLPTSQFGLVTSATPVGLIGGSSSTNAVTHTGVAANRLLTGLQIPPALGVQGMREPEAARGIVQVLRSLPPPGGSGTFRAPIEASVPRAIVSPGLGQGHMRR